MWKLGEREVVIYTIARKTGHKLAWDVPRACHSYLVQTVLTPHVGSLRVSLLHREVGFFHGLLASPTSEVAVAALLSARDLPSTAGTNLALVREVAGMDPWTAGKRDLRAALEAADRDPVQP